MARVEIDENELAALQGIQGRVAQIMAVPAARKKLLTAIKDVDPKASIPEIDAAAPINDAMQSVRDELAAMRAEREAEKQQAEQDARIRALQGRWAAQEATLRTQGWREQGIAQVRAFAEENGIGDLSIAADSWSVRNPAPAPQSSGGPWALFGGTQEEDDTYVEDLMKSADLSGNVDERRVDREISAAIAAARAA
jgi:hypothetical protein